MIERNKSDYENLRVYYINEIDEIIRELKDYKEKIEGAIYFSMYNLHRVDFRNFNPDELELDENYLDFFVKNAKRDIRALSKIYVSDVYD